MRSPMKRTLGHASTTPTWLKGEHEASEKGVKKTFPATNSIIFFFKVYLIETLDYIFALLSANIPTCECVLLDDAFFPLEPILPSIAASFLLESFPVIRELRQFSDLVIITLIAVETWVGQAETKWYFTDKNQLIHPQSDHSMKFLLLFLLLLLRPSSSSNDFHSTPLHRNVHLECTYEEQYAMHSTIQGWKDELLLCSLDN